jgi:hypothetical protein
VGLIREGNVVGVLTRANEELLILKSFDSFAATKAGVFLGACV